jgi:hypothetical protein
MLVATDYCLGHELVSSSADWAGHWQSFQLVAELPTAIIIPLVLSLHCDELHLQRSTCPFVILRVTENIFAIIGGIASEAIREVADDKERALIIRGFLETIAARRDGIRALLSFRGSFRVYSCHGWMSGCRLSTMS